MAKVLPRIARRLGTKPWVMRRKAAILKLDRGVRRITKGRRGVLDIAGLPSLELTVVGRKSGIPRTTSLLYVPDGDMIMLVGSNWGSPEHPSWSANLRAADAATVHIRDERFQVAVAEITGVEWKLAWDHAVDYWPGYEIEHELSGHRKFRIFELRRT
ncbi:nitroreductase family deazaflavin-dependent oxidoreductase [Nocardia sp. NPDC050406]|uniref:nitroreductase family deazaflavin-dependent oxidoreductase n=1 Tax=Nocardia sp. NPDC050406 TaxID=3364318 RepID=UPI0037983170